MASEDSKKSRATLLDVAQRANVSRATASLVIRNSPLVGEATRLRVQAAIKELGYVYNLGAARLRAERSHTVGVIVPNLTNPFFAELLAGIESVIDVAGMVVLLANSADLPDRQDMVIQRMREHGVDGLILCPAAGTEPDLFRRLADWRLPLVQVLRRFSHHVDYAGVDYAGGMRQAVEYLSSLGHEKIAFAVHGLIHPAYQERVDGFREAMSAHGFDASMIIRVPDQLVRIAAAAHLLFEEQTQPTAVICFNDVIALGLAAGLYDRGIAIGRDLSLVGFDDVTDAEAVRPRLTSVATMPAEIGKNAARLLLDRLKEPALPPRSMVRPAVFHVRQSCGPAAALTA
ncbi:LacI family transcriptional regulator [Brucella endophytica]|uniref:LacI family transcriptional regulator n=1 Tax=Brucella endophytica TaxID=1963359 RepID=A0A916WGI4_9HYPH|nr:LacI family DNA-binding transcriptional regulator [Brucella endophytica]GGA95053.1 LacI family transcriptional regulator [Brucella endophytica]